MQDQQICEKVLREPVCEELSIELTSLCHHACRHCSTNGVQKFLVDRKSFNKHRKDYDELTLEEIKRIIREAKETLGTTTVSLSGGEPLLHPDIVEIIDFIKQLDLRVLLYTCFPEDADELLSEISMKLNGKECGNPDKIIYSMEGMSEAHDFIVGNSGHFYSLISDIEDAAYDQMYVEVHTCPMTTNMDQLIDMVHQCLEIGVNRVSYLRLVPQGRCQKNTYLMPTDLDFLLMQGILAYIDKKFTGIEIRVGDPMNFLWLVSEEHAKKISTCSAAKDRILIRPDGKAHFCAALKHAEEMNYGNIKEDSLEHIWYESDVAKTLRGFHRECDICQTCFTGSCSACKHFDKCKGGCLSQRLAKFKKVNKIRMLKGGTMDQAIYSGPDPQCPLQTARFHYHQWKNNDKSVTFLTHLLHAKYGYNPKNIPDYWSEISQMDDIDFALMVR